MPAPSEVIWARSVGFSETDAMGVVHHANYLKFFEEARVHWLRSQGVESYHYPHYDLVLAVVESQCRHLKNLKFGDDFEVRLQLRRERLKIRFQYAIYCFERHGEALVASGETLHVPLTSALEVCRWPGPLKDELEKQPWTETWLSNL